MSMYWVRCTDAEGEPALVNFAEANTVRQCEWLKTNSMVTFGRGASSQIAIKETLDELEQSIKPNAFLDALKMKREAELLHVVVHALLDYIRQGKSSGFILSHLEDHIRLVTRKVTDRWIEHNRDAGELDRQKVPFQQWMDHLYNQALKEIRDVKEKAAQETRRAGHQDEKDHPHG